MPTPISTHPDLHGLVLPRTPPFVQIRPSEAVEILLLLAVLEILRSLGDDVDGAAETESFANFPG